MKIREKLIGGFSILILLIVLLGILGVITNKNIYQEEQIIDEIRQHIENLDDLLRYDLQLINTTNIDDYFKIKSYFEETRKEFDILYEKHNKFIHDLVGGIYDEKIIDFTKISNSIISLHEEKLIREKEFITKKGMGRSEQELKEITIEQEKIKAEEFLKINQLINIIDDIKEIKKNIISATRSKVESLIKNIQLGYLGAFLIIFINSIIFGLYITNLVTKPIIKLRDTAVEIGKGNLTLKAEIKSKDEIGQLAASFNKMVEDVLNAEKEREALTEEYTKGLGEKVRERTAELERMNKFMVGRELRMAELKKEIEKLKKSGNKLKSQLDA